jgi:hypothetical protein
MAKFRISILINNLLNQNNSISRTISDVAVTDVFTNVLTRYGMITLLTSSATSSSPQPSRSSLG